MVVLINGTYSSILVIHIFLYFFLYSQDYNIQRNRDKRILNVSAKTKENFTNKNINFIVLVRLKQIHRKLFIMLSYTGSYLTLFLLETVQDIDSSKYIFVQR